MFVENSLESHKPVENQPFTLYERFCGRAGVLEANPALESP